MKKGLLGKIALALASMNTGCIPIINAALSNRHDIKATQNYVSPNKKPKLSFRVMTYNIAHGRGNITRTKYPNMGHSLHELGLNTQMTPSSMKKNLDNIAALIRKIKPDILILNEVDFNASWSFNTDQIKYLAEKTGLKYHSYGTKWDFSSALIQFHCGNAVLSNYPISGSNEFFRKQGFKNWVWGDVSYLDVMVKNGKKINVIGSHFDGGLRRRNHQARVVTRQSKKRIEDGIPVIIAGDLNAEPPAANKANGEKRTKVLETILGSGNFHLFWKFNQHPDSKEAKSVRTSNNGESIDHIIISKDLGYKNCFVPDVDYSDHKPLVCDIYFK